MRTERHFYRQQREQECATHRDFISEWTKAQSIFVYSVGRAMTAASAYGGLPFLLPGAASYEIFQDTILFSKTIYGGDSFATPSVAWCPTVLHADRETYERVMSFAAGYEVNITRVQSGGEGSRWSAGLPAPAAAKYNPVSVGWSVRDDSADSPAVVEELLGADIRLRGRQMWPAAAARVFEERRIAAFSPYQENGEPAVDDVLYVFIPYCGPVGCGVLGAEVLGIWTLGLVAEFWGGIFPAHFEVTALDGEQIKTVNRRNYDDFVQLHEPQLDLQLRCYYETRSIFRTAAPYLWLGAIGLLIFAVAVALVHLLENRMRHIRVARRQFGILNTSPDAIASLALSGNRQEMPKMEILNPGGHHRFHGATSTMALSGVVSACDVARVWDFLEDPTSRATEFESRFVDAASGRAIPYEVAVSPVVASKHQHGERICIFRDVLLRAQREEESLRGAQALARAEEHLNHELKTEKYLSHELKNRIIVLVELSLRCAETHSPATPLPDTIRAKLATLSGMANELLETTVRKSVLLHLATGVYEPRLEDTDISQLLATRLTRLADAGRDVVLHPTDGAAAECAASLLLDPLLVNIIADNLLSNAIKYGAAAEPPSVAVRIEPVEDGIVSLSFVVRNLAGPSHERLLALGDEQLNLIAATEGQRAHGSQSASLSAGDGFPMAVASAAALGGTLRLGLAPTEVIATLTLPRVRLDATEQFAVMDIQGLTTALVEDSLLQRKMWTRRISGAFASSATPILAGETHASIEDFPRAVVGANVDVVFVDQHFGSVHSTKVGTDLVREIRVHDRAAGVPDRLIFVVSANDASEDVEFYNAAGASGHLQKSISIQRLHARICQMASSEPRFKGRLRRVAAAAPEKAERPWRAFSA